MVCNGVNIMFKSYLPNAITGIQFKERPEPVPFNYRISYKVAQLCIILFMIKKGGCSFEKLQMIASAISNEYAMMQVIDYINGKLPDYSIISFDPSVNYALLYARAEELIVFQANGKMKLSEKGKQFAREIFDNEIMENEKNSLKKIIGDISDEAVAELVKRWGGI
jgi:hypothetical protein